MKLLPTTTTYFPLLRAMQVAATNQKHDPDWKYEVIDCEDGTAYIKIYDEDGHYTGNL